MLAPGTRLGGLVIGPLLGRGGMGEVYRAEQVSLGRAVAAKRINDNLVQSQDVIARFRREARLAAGISHPNVLTVFDFGEFCDSRGETHWMLVMELVEQATSLRSLLGSIDWRTATSHIAQACLGLSAAHDKGIIHRDLKPDNLLIAPDGTVKLADFGLATAADVSVLTAPGAQVGTPRYMAPELLKGMPGDERSDLYSLGITWYQALCGRSPFEGTTGAIMLAHLETPPPPVRRFNADVPAEVEVLVHACLAKRPEDRPASALEVARQLAAYLPTEHTRTTATIAAVSPNGSRRTDSSATATVPANRPGTGVQRRPGGDRRWLLGVFAAAVVVVAGGAFALLAWWGGGRSWEVPARPAWAADFGRDARSWWADLAVGTQIVRLRYCPPGTFRQGDPPELRSASTDVEQQHSTILSRGWWLGETEVTQEVWNTVMGSNPAAHQVPRHPVESITWTDAVRFCDTLTHSTRIPARLPTEAEWERACRAGMDMPVDTGSAAKAELTSLAVEAAKLVDPIRHGAVRDEQSPEYAAAIAPLVAFQATHPEIRYLYTLRRDGDLIRFVLDTTPIGDRDRDGVEDHSFLNEAYLKPSPEALACLKDGSLTVEDFREDRWGVIISAYAPLRSADGTITAILGVDVEAPVYRQMLAKALAQSTTEAGWFQDNSGGKHHEIATRSPNAWGFYDLQGNVAEWCADAWQAYPAEPQTDPLPRSGPLRVFRGGSFNFSSDTGRIGQRARDEQDYAVPYRGMRLAADAEPGRL